MVRVGPRHYTTALSRHHSREMDFTGRPLRGATCMSRVKASGHARPSGRGSSGVLRSPGHFHRNRLRLVDDSLGHPNVLDRKKGSERLLMAQQIREP